MTLISNNTPNASPIEFCKRNALFSLPAFNINFSQPFTCNANNELICNITLHALTIYFVNIIVCSCSVIGNHTIA